MSEKKKEIQKAETKLPAVKITPEELKTFLAGEGVELNEKEFRYFLELARVNNLNPFKREIYVIKQKNGRIDFVTGYEVYLKRAEATGLLNGWKAWVEGDDPRTAVAKIIIRRKDWEFPFEWEVYGNEFYKPSEKGTGSWDKMWKHMLRKVVISQGFRLAFPELLGGMPYTSDEIQASTWERQASEEPAEVEVKNLKGKTEKLKEKLKDDKEEKEKKHLRKRVGDLILQLVNGDYEKARKFVAEHAKGKDIRELSIDELLDLETYTKEQLKIHDAEIVEE